MTSTTSHPPAAADPPTGAAAEGAAAGPPVPQPAAPDLGDRLAAVEAELTAVAQRLADDSARAAARERVIDRQHAEIERLRSAERSGLLRPVVTDLYRLRNDLLRQAAGTPVELTGDRARALLHSFADDVADALERCGVAVLPCPPGGPPEPGRHQVAAVRPTSRPEQDGTIAEVLQDGYLESDSGRVVTPARIALYRFGEQPRPEGSADD